MSEPTAPERCDTEAPGPLGKGLNCCKLTGHDGPHSHGIFNWAPTRSGIQAALDALDDLVSDLDSLSDEDVEAVSAWANNIQLDIMRHQRIRGGSRV